MTDNIAKKFTTNKELANYYDEIKNINKTIEYSFLVCIEDPNDTISITKIVYWASFYKQYDDVIKLIGIIKNNKIQLDKLKEVFFKENKTGIKSLIIKYYLELIKQKENFINDVNKIKSGTIDNKYSLYEYLNKFYKLTNEWEFIPLYEEYIIEKKLFDEYYENYKYLFNN